MRFGLRRFSIRKRIAARTFFRCYIRHSHGVKVPRGWGMITSQKRAARNRVFHRTAVDMFKALAKLGK
ncbi:MAG: hypothetical protein ACHP84_04225 [Caulobacterales bacterium]